MAAAQTDIGLVKQVNQDSLTVKVADTKLGEVSFAVICDGMGGLAKGELASAILVRAFEKWFYEQLPLSLGQLNEAILRKECHKNRKTVNNQLKSAHLKKKRRKKICSIRKS